MCNKLLSACLHVTMDAGEVPGSYHALHSLLHLGQGVCIFLGLGVQASEIDTEAEGAILLSHQHHGIAPR